MTADAGALHNPTHIARETLRQLASKRVAPTPDNYAQFYHEIAGTQAPQTPPGAAWGSLIRELLRLLDARHQGLTATRKREALERALSPSGEPAGLHTRLQALVRSWAESPTIRAEAVAEEAAARGMPSGSASAEDLSGSFRDLLSKTLQYGLTTQLHHAPELAAEAEALSRTVNEVRDRASFARFSGELKRFWFKLELRGEDGAEQQEGLLRLLRLLLDNVGELLTDDRWLAGQVEAVRTIIAGPLSIRALDDAERSLKEVIYKQGGLKHSLNEARATLKSMIATFIGRLGDLSEETGDYHHKIEVYSRKIGETDDITQLGRILEDILRETRLIQASTLRSRDELVVVRKEAEGAEEKIRSLEAELTQVSELVRADPLTGALNRRGLDDQFGREAARAERSGRPLCVALIDIDNFKQLNDRYGHQAGDDALVHLARVVRHTIRPTDAIARFGGEEFVVLLPETELAEAAAVTARLQRELTRKLFLHNNERLLITFSAGVALRAAGEPRESVLARADAALYEAKRTGKNRVVSAP